MGADLLRLTLALIAGLGLGVVFFGGLWLTVQRLPTARRPLPLAFGSLVARMGIAVGGFSLLSGAGWDALVAGVVGFLLMRQALIRRLRPDAAPRARPAEPDETEGGEGSW